MDEDRRKRNLRPLWIGLGLLALFSPLGLVLPAWLGSGKAWGEWSAEELRGMTGAVPRGLAGLQNTWHSLMPDYTIPGLGANLGYVVSALVGVAIVAGLTLLLGRLIAKKGEDEK